MPTRACIDCGVPTLAGYRCPEHERDQKRQRRRIQPCYSMPQWTRLRNRVVARHVREQGYWCPGFRREPHLTADLTGDHIVELRRGGAPFDESNVQVLCRSCNSRKRAWS